METLIPGLGISAISFFLRYAVTAMPKVLAWVGVAVGALLIVAGLDPMKAYLTGPAILGSVGAICLVGAIAWHYSNRASDKLPPEKASNEIMVAPEEAIRRQAVIRELINEYQRAHGQIPVPVDWIDQRLESLNEKWRAPRGPSLTITNSHFENLHPGAPAAVFHGAKGVHITDTNFSAVGAPGLIVNETEDFRMKGSDVKSKPAEKEK